MIKELVRQCIKKVVRGIHWLLELKKLNWRDICNAIVRESVLTVITVAITVVTMNVMGV